MAKKARGKKAGKVKEAKEAKARGPAYLPGMAPKKDAAVHAAGLGYAEARDARMNAGRIEQERKAKLIDALKKKGLSIYRYGDLKITLESKDKVKVIYPDQDEDETEPEAVERPYTEAELDPNKVDENLEPVAESTEA